MSSIIFDGVTSNMLKKSLDMCSINHRVIAMNMANINTIGYQPLTFDFNAAMKSLEQAGAGASKPSEVANNIRNLDVERYQYPSDSGNNIEIDKEMIRLAENMTHYQALITARKSYGAIMSMAIRGGK